MITDLMKLFPDPADFRTEESRAALVEMLNRLHALLGSMPADDASEEEVQSWAREIVDEWTRDEPPQPQMLGVSWSEWVLNIISPVLKPIKKGLSEVDGKINSAVQTVRQDIEGEIEAVGKRLRDVESVFEKVEERIKAKLWDVAKYPVSKSKEEITNVFNNATEPVRDKLIDATHLFEIARVMHNSKILDIGQRLLWTGNALAYLCGDNKEIKAVFQILKDLIDNEDSTQIGDDLLALVEAVLVNCSPLFAALDWFVRSVAAGKLYLPDDMGVGFTPGRLYGFINGETGQPLDPDEREFRIELAVALDRYFHGEYHAPGLPSKPGQPRSTHLVDGRSAVQVLTDLLRIVLQTAFDFSFRIPNVPSMMAPKMSLLRRPSEHTPQLVAARHASGMLGRALTSPVKAVTGLLLRGLWEVNLYNESLVELISTSVAQTMGSLFESISHALFAVLEIREVYNDPKDADRCIYSWPTAATWGDDASHTTFQAVVVRKGLLGDDAPALALEDDLSKKLKALVAPAGDSDSMLTLLLKDYGTYLELSRDCHEPNLEGKTAIDVQMEWSGPQALHVKATFEDPDAALAVVLRAYAAGTSVVLSPAVTAETATHEGDITCSREQVEDVYVLAGMTAFGREQAASAGAS